MRAIFILKNILESKLIIIFFYKIQLNVGLTNVVGRSFDIPGIDFFTLTGSDISIPSHLLSRFIGSS